MAHCTKRAGLFSLIFAFIATLALCLPAAPAWADGVVAKIGDNEYATLQDAIDAVPVDGTATTIKLQSDLTLDEQVVIQSGQNVILDLDSYTITENGVGARKIINNGTFSIEAAEGGTICNTDESTGDSGGSYGLIDNYGTLTIKSGSFINNAKGDGAAIKNRSGATLYIEDGIFKGMPTDDTRKDASNTLVSNDGTLTIMGGTFSSQSKVTPVIKQFDGTANIGGAAITSAYSAGMEIAGGSAVVSNCVITIENANSHYASAIAASGGAIVTVDGGTYISAGYGVYVYNSGGTITVEGGSITGSAAAIKADITTGSKNAVVSVTGGTFEGDIATGGTSTNSEVEITVSGGIFSQDVPSEYRAAGFAAQPITVDGQTKYLVVGSDGVAIVDGTPYDSLQAAINAVKNGSVTGTIVLQKSVLESVEIPSGASITLDLNGQTITNEAGKHTITNNGTLTIVDNSESVGTVDNITHVKAAIYNYGTLTIEGGTFTRSQEEPYTKDANGKNSYYVLVNVGTIEEISGGVFRTGTGDSSTLGNFSSLIRNGDGAETGTIKRISGGTFTSAANVLKNEPDSTIESITGGVFVMDNTVNLFWGGNHILQNYGTIGSVTGAEFRAIGSGQDLREGTAYARYGIYSTGSISLGDGVVLDMTGDNNRGLAVRGSGSIAITGGSYSVVTDSEDPDAGSSVLFDKSDGATAAVSGGSFSEEVPLAWCKEGYIPQTVVDDKGMCTVIIPVAKNGDEKYASLKEALAAAVAGDTVELVSNAVVEPNDKLVVPAGVTLRVSAPTVLENCGTIIIEEGADGTPDARLVVSDGAQLLNQSGIIKVFGVLEADSDLGIGGTVNYYAKSIAIRGENGTTLPDPLTIVVDESVQLEAALDPDNAVDEVKWSSSSKDVTVSADGKVTVEHHVAGSDTNPITITATTANGKTATVQIVTAKKTVDAPVSVQGSNVSIEGKSDGSITGVSAGMEYQKQGDSEWASCAGSTIEGLSEGVYYVRYAETGDSNASDAVEVEIAYAEQATYALSASVDAATAPYGQAVSMPIIISNTGNSDATISDVAVSGDDAAQFKITSGSQTVLAGDSVSDWAIAPDDDLSVGTYTATITVTYDGGATAEAQVVFTVTPASQGSLDDPVATTRTYTSIELAAVPVSTASGEPAEYSIDGGDNWQQSPVFNGLMPGQSYTVMVRYPASSDGNYAETQSASVTVFTSAFGATKDTVALADADALSAERDELEAAVASDTYSDEQKQTLNGRIAEIDAAFTALDHAADASDAIANLPAAADVTKADADAINAAKGAYDALTDHEKELVGADAKAKLDAAVAALAALDAPTTPDEPDEPDTPVAPVDPDTPTDSGYGDKSGEVKAPDQPAKTEGAEALSQTGDTLASLVPTVIGIAVAAAAVACIALAVSRRRPKGKHIR